MNKIRFLLIAASITFTAFAYAENEVVAAKPEQQTPEVTVYRSPTCSCCEKWVAHLKQNNFSVRDIVTEDMQGIKAKYAVSAEMASCHTALVNGYVVEGHVPAKDIQQMLTTKPSIVGIAVPGMPMGTPGMEMGGKRDAFEVLSFDDKNQSKVFNSYQAN